MLGQITVTELARRLKAPDAPLLLDVREPWELEAARVAGSVDIPMSEIPKRLAELPKDREIAVMCHAGGRSLRVAGFLDAQGYRSVLNVTGGIHAWSLEVDPSVPTY